MNASEAVELDRTPRPEELPGGPIFAEFYAEAEMVAASNPLDPWHRRDATQREQIATNAAVTARMALAQARRAGFESIADFIAATTDPIEVPPKRPRVLPAAESIPSTVWTVGDLAALPSAEEEAIIGDGILTRGGKLLLYAKSGAGKTTMLDFLAGPLATGRPFLERYAVDRPRRVLVVQGELSVPEMASHAQQLVAAGFADDRLLFSRMTSLRLPEGEETLRALIRAHGIEVVCLDPWYRLFAGESSDKAEQVGTVFDVCDRLLEDGLVEAAIVVHHANVTGLRTAGSWLFEGWPSTILRLETVPGILAHRILTFEKVRAPSSSLLGERLQIVLTDDGYRPVVVAERSVDAGPTLAVILVREAGGQLPRAELIDRLMARASCRERAAAKYLGQAVQAGSLRSVRDGAKALYLLGEAES